MKFFHRMASQLAFAGAAIGASMAPAQAQTTYQVPSLSDFSGPFASVMPFFAGARESVISWWNAEQGAALGVKLELKPFDTRYDTAQTASLWPGVLASTKPVIGFALGGPDTAALQQRLPNDKVPLILGSASNGFGWRSNQWVLSTRPTFVHEIGGFIEWFQQNKAGGNRPVKVPLACCRTTSKSLLCAKVTLLGGDFALPMRRAATFGSCTNCYCACIGAWWRGSSPRACLRCASILLSIAPRMLAAIDMCCQAPYSIRNLCRRYGFMPIS